jgi:hypothetical protein
LRRILGHTTYVMVMRYVHLDKGDLARGLAIAILSAGSNPGEGDSHLPEFDGTACYRRPGIEW